MSKDQANSSKFDKRVKIRLLKSLGLFQSLDAGELEVIAANSAWRSLAKGEIIYPKERGSGRIYIVQKGEVSISKSGDEQRNIILATFVAGESFGELTLFDRGGTDTSARCDQDTTLLVFPEADGIDTPETDDLFRSYPTIQAKLLRNLLVLVARRIRTSNRLIAEKSPWVQELRRQVMLDKLTGLYNAGYLEEELPKLLKDESAGTCLLMIKPDNLKTLNDRYGHQAGDRTLQLMASELNRQLKDRGIAIRYKGDVFSVLLPQAGVEEARNTAERIRSAMSEIDVSEVSRDSAEPRSDLRITVSVGIAVYLQEEMNAERLSEQAYENMFSARNSGGNRVCSGQES